MKKLLFGILLTPFALFSQVCNPNGNIMIYSNYDGGVLNINVDQNIPNLKIGIVTYEGTTINLSGPFVNNVTAIEYAGYNGSNAHCGSVINTSINGAPGTATTAINLYPAATLSNPNGYNFIICAYSCDNNTNQGGCNTVDQVEDYFINQFNGTLYAHYTQYGCWSNTFNVSSGGNCCPAQPLSSAATILDIVCAGICSGSATVSAFGGTPPYSYLWSNGCNGQTCSDLCAGQYDVFITDNNGNTITETVIITEPIPISGNITSTPETGSCDGTANIVPSGGTGNYTYLWDLAGNNQTTATAVNLCSGSPCVTVTDEMGCTETFCTTVQDASGIEELLPINKILLKVTDFTGRETNYAKNTPLILIFSDGTRERIYHVQD